MTLSQGLSGTTNRVGTNASVLGETPTAPSPPNQPSVKCFNYLNFCSISLSIRPLPSQTQLSSRT